MHGEAMVRSSGERSTMALRIEWYEWYTTVRILWASSTQKLSRNLVRSIVNKIYLKKK